jgi:23S rRNA (adenine2030-N6)-methyltransferase
LNYRHAFHAGNFADLAKHAALLALLQRMTKGEAPLTVVDTHAGAGVYDLSGPEARRSGEAAAGVERLLAAKDAPPALEALARVVRRANGDKALRFYPGSPWLVAETLRPKDRYLGFELRPEEHAALARTLRGRKTAESRCADGFAEAPRVVPAKGPALILVDPPFERSDDYARTARLVGAVRRRNPQAATLVWLPLKDLDTLDSFLRDLEGQTGGEPLLVAETRLRRLDDPLRMNGCVLVAHRAPSGLAAQMEQVCGWIAGASGEKGAAARIWTQG